MFLLWIPVLMLIKSVNKSYHNEIFIDKFPIPSEGWSQRRFNGETMNIVKDVNTDSGRRSENQT